jgi:hypothetical protein
MTSDEGNNEDIEEEGPLLPSPDSGWLLVATKLDGHVTWEAGYEAIEQCVNALSFLQERPDPDPTHARLLRGLKHLAELKHFEFPLNDFDDFLELKAFLNISYSNLWGYSDHLFIDRDLTDPRCRSLLGEFAELARRLKLYEPLRDYWQYM